MSFGRDFLKVFEPGLAARLEVLEAVGLRLLQTHDLVPTIGDELLQDVVG